MQTTLITRQEVQAFCRLSASSLRRLARTGNFPQPIKIGLPTEHGKIAYLRAEIEGWLQARIDKAHAACLPLHQSTSDEQGGALGLPTVVAPLSR